MTSNTVLVNPEMASGEVSPKVTIPALALLVLGIALMVLHFILNDGSNTLLDIGLSLIGASGLVGVGGYSAKVGRVQLPPGKAVQTGPVNSGPEV